MPINRNRINNKIQITQYRKNLGDLEKKKKYISQHQIQNRINHISNSSRIHPNGLVILSLALLLRNVQQSPLIPCQYTETKKNHCNINNALSYQTNKVISVVSTSLNITTKTTDIAPSFYSKINNVNRGENIPYENAISLFERITALLPHYDPLTFPTAAASQVHTTPTSIISNPAIVSTSSQNHYISCEQHESNPRYCMYRNYPSPISVAEEWITPFLKNKNITYPPSQIIMLTYKDKYQGSEMDDCFQEKISNCHEISNKTLPQIIDDNFSASERDHFDYLNKNHFLYFIPDLKKSDQRIKLDINATDIMYYLWNNDFYEYYINKLTNYWNENQNQHTQSLISHYLINLKIEQEDLSEISDKLFSSDQSAIQFFLSFINNTTHNLVKNEVFLFDINGYTATDMLVMTSEDRKKWGIYMPHSLPHFYLFDSKIALDKWVVNMSSNKNEREKIMRHFPISALMDGRTIFGKEGVKSWLEKEISQHRYLDRICYNANNKLNPLEKPYWSSLTEIQKSVSFSNADHLIKSNGEVSLDMVKGSLSIINMFIPNPLTISIETGIDISTLLMADNKKGQDASLSFIKDDLINIAITIGIDVTNYSINFYKKRIGFIPDDVNLTDDTKTENNLNIMFRKKLRSVSHLETIDKLSITPNEVKNPAANYFTLKKKDYFSVKYITEDNSENVYLYAIKINEKYLPIRFNRHINQFECFNIRNEQQAYPIYLQKNILGNSWKFGINHESNPLYNKKTFSFLSESLAEKITTEHETTLPKSYTTPINNRGIAIFSDKEYLLVKKHYIGITPTKDGRYTIDATIDATIDNKKVEIEWDKFINQFTLFDENIEEILNTLHTDIQSEYITTNKFFYTQEQIKTIHDLHVIPTDENLAKKVNFKNSVYTKVFNQQQEIIQCRIIYINDNFIPIRPIIHPKLSNQFEAFNLLDEGKTGFPVYKDNQDNWCFGLIGDTGYSITPTTSIFMEEDLLQEIIRNGNELIPNYTIKLDNLMPMNSKGISHTTDGNCYLRTNNGFVKIKTSNKENVIIPADKNIEETHLIYDNHTGKYKKSNTYKVYNPSHSTTYNEDYYISHDELINKLSLDKNKITLSEKPRANKETKYHLTKIILPNGKEKEIKTIKINGNVIPVRKNNHLNVMETYMITHPEKAGYPVYLQPNNQWKLGFTSELSNNKLIKKRPADFISHDIFDELTSKNILETTIKNTSPINNKGIMIMPDNNKWLKGKTGFYLFEGTLKTGMISDAITNKKVPVYFNHDTFRFELEPHAYQTGDEISSLSLIQAMNPRKTFRQGFRSTDETICKLALAEDENTREHIEEIYKYGLNEITDKKKYTTKVTAHELNSFTKNIKKSADDLEKNISNLLHKIDTEDNLPTIKKTFESLLKLKNVSSIEKEKIWQTFYQNVKKTYRLLLQNQIDNYEKIWIISTTDPHICGFVGQDDPLHRIYISLSAHLNNGIYSQKQGTLTLLHEASHLSSHTQDYFYFNPEKNSLQKKINQLWGRKALTTKEKETLLNMPEARKIQNRWQTNNDNKLAKQVFRQIPQARSRMILNNAETFAQLLLELIEIHGGRKRRSEPLYSNNRVKGPLLLLLCHAISTPYC